MTFFPKTCRLWGSVEKYDKSGQATDDITVRRMIHAWRLPKTTNTHSGYIILTAILQQNLLQTRTYMLRYTHTDCGAVVGYRYEIF
jgi:hypothetical protein